MWAVHALRQGLVLLTAEETAPVAAHSAEAAQAPTVRMAQQTHLHAVRLIRHTVEAVAAAIAVAEVPSVAAVAAVAVEAPSVAAAVAVAEVALSEAVDK